VLADRILPKSAGPVLAITILISFGALLSAFMNNVGAMALLMPVAIQLAAKHELPPGKVLMPLAFGTILGGMTTLIGTPPNLIVSGFRMEETGSSFGMFDFTPVGIAIAGLGIVFVAILGWRIVPARKQGEGESFDTGTYLTEARINEKSRAVDKTLREVEKMMDDIDAQIVGMVRNDLRISAPSAHRHLRAGDLLVIEAEPESLESVLSTLGLTLEESITPDSEPEDTEKNQRPTETNENNKKPKAPDIELQELVAMPDSGLIGRSASDIELRTRYSLNLLAISRRGRRTIKRLRSTPIQAGDVLLIQGEAESLSAFINTYNCVPLAKRSIHIPDKGRTAMATIVMALAVAGAAFGLLPAAISFAAGVFLFIVLRIVPVRKVYETIDWSVIILLGALLPVATAMAMTGTADLLAHGLLSGIAQGHPVVALALILIVTMTLSDFMNNAATAAVMCPIAISTATQLGVSPDSFLMAVAIGASCAFLTPIGHQNNTLILGPGGFGFGDYWKLGLPIEILVIITSIPMLLLVWPL
jgi:di/tricarboxylate transporter